jgi:hypothetical protein
MIVETIYQQPEAAYLMEPEPMYDQLIVEALDEYVRLGERVIYTSSAIIVMLVIFVILRIIQKKQKNLSKITT